MDTDTQTNTNTDTDTQTQTWIQTQTHKQTQKHWYRHRHRNRHTQTNKHKYKKHKHTQTKWKRIHKQCTWYDPLWLTCSSCTSCHRITYTIRDGNPVLDGLWSDTDAKNDTDMSLTTVMCVTMMTYDENGTKPRRWWLQTLLKGKLSLLCILAAAPGKVLV